MPNLAAIHETFESFGRFLKSCVLDVVRLSAKRCMALAGVCYLQARRRRVFWIAPAIMLGILIVAGLAKPIDAQDEIRQSIKFCLFATGMLVTMLTVILAATNLPKEIETRVIYTIATKPATRLEIVLGKILGFAMISGTFLVIMGVFTFAYLEIRQVQLRNDITHRLATAGEVEASNRPTLTYYRDKGLLHARRFETPEADALEVFSTLPSGQGPGWIRGGGDQEINIPFINFTPMLMQKAGSGAAAPDFVVHLQVTYRKAPRATTLPTSVPATLPAIPFVEVVEKPRIGLAFLNGDARTIVGMALTGPSNGHPLNASDAWIEVRMDSRVVEALSGVGDRIYLQVIGANPDYEYNVGEGLPARSRAWVESSLIKPSIPAIPPMSAPIYVGRWGTFGQQVRGDTKGDGPAGLFRFRNVNFHPDAQGKCAFEFRSGIERSSDEEDQFSETTQVGVQLINRTFPERTANVTLAPESTRAVDFDVPAAVVEGGDFDVQIRCNTSGHWLGLKSGPKGSLRLVTENQPFAWNLLKSFFVMWLMSVLVATVAIFCSTFVSWPIAVVLTLLILLGRWGVDQFGDLHGTGLGRTFANDMFKGASPAQANAIKESVDVLTALPQMLARFLPDVGQFASAEAPESGIAILPSVIISSLKVLLCFALPLAFLTYLALRNKEVAP